MIVHNAKTKKFEVRTEDGSRLLGEHDSEEEAQKQLVAIELSKMRRRKP